MSTPAFVREAAREMGLSIHALAAYTDNLSVDASPLGYSVFRPEDHGVVDVTGVADSSGAVLAAILACYEAGGGTVSFPVGTIRIDSQIAMPHDGSSTEPTTVPIRLLGQGVAWAGGYVTTNRGREVAATVFDMRVDSADAALLCIGTGQLRIEGIQFQNLSDAALTTPFVKTTNTTLNIENCAFIGHDTLVGTDTLQDAIVLGGTGGVYNTDLPSGAFSGYGTHINHNYFSRIRVAVLANEWAESIKVMYNFISWECGGTAPFVVTTTNDNGTTDASNFGNMYLGNRIALTHYDYAWDLTGLVTVSAMGDATEDGNGLALVNANQGPQDSTGPGWIGFGVDYKGTVLFTGDWTYTSYLYDSQGGRGLLYTSNPEQSAFVSIVGVPGDGHFAYQNAGNLPGWTAFYAYARDGSTKFFQIDADKVAPVKMLTAPFGDYPVATGSRPSAVDAGAGACCFDLTLSKPIWSDGTDWRDASGTIV